MSAPPTRLLRSSTGRVLPGEVVFAFAVKRRTALGSGPSLRVELRNLLDDFREFALRECPHRGGFDVALRSDGEGDGGSHFVARTFRHSDDVVLAHRDVEAKDLPPKGFSELL